MSVRANERGESVMEFINSAHELEIYTRKAVNCEGTIPKRDRLLLGKDLISSARKINECVRYANAVYLKDEETLKLRSQYQRTALYEIQNFLELLTIASEIHPIKSTVLETWVGIVLKEEHSIKGWMRSDTSRYKK